MNNYKKEINVLITSSKGTSLVFEDSEFLEEYEKNLEKLEIETYKKIRDKYGIYANNQGKFVQTREDLNEYDGTFMEDLLDKHLAMQDNR